MTSKAKGQVTSLAALLWVERAHQRPGSHKSLSRCLYVCAQKHTLPSLLLTYLLNAQAYIYRHESVFDSLDHLIKICNSLLLKSRNQSTEQSILFCSLLWTALSGSVIKGRFLHLHAGLEVRQSSVFKKPTDKTSDVNESEKKTRGGGDDSHRRLCLGLEGTGRIKQGQSHRVDSLMSGSRLRGAGKEEEEQTGDAQQHREQERLCRDVQDLVPNYCTPEWHTITHFKTITSSLCEEKI